MSEFKKFGPLIDEKGLGWVFSASSIPTPIQEQVKDWFYYRRINDASEDKFQRMFKRKLYAVEPRFLALMSAQAMEIDPLVQEMFEATVAATREGKTVVNEAGTETATGEGRNTQHRTGNNTSNTTTTGESSGTSKATSNSDVSGNESTTHTIDENGSDSTTHTGGEARADSAYPESALSTPGPLPTPDTITLTHLANMTVNNRNSHDGTLTVRKGNNKDEGTRSSHTEGTTNGETTGRTSGSSEGTVVTSEDITGSNTSNNSIIRGRDSTTTNDGKDSSTTTNKGRHMSAQELLSKYLDFIYRCDAILWFVNELEGCFLAVYDDSGVDCFVWDGDGEAGKDGKDGVTFVPHVQALANGYRLYWTNDGRLPNPDPMEIMNGENGAPGAVGPAGPSGPAGAVFTPMVTEIEGGIRLSWSNNGELPNPDPVDIKGSGSSLSGPSGFLVGNVNGEAKSVIIRPEEDGYLEGGMVLCGRRDTNNRYDMYYKKLAMSTQVQSNNYVITQSGSNKKGAAFTDKVNGIRVMNFVLEDGSRHFAILFVKGSNNNLAFCDSNDIIFTTRRFDFPLSWNVTYVTDKTLTFTPDTSASTNSVWAELMEVTQ